MTKDEDIREHLLSNSPDFRRLVEEHHLYEVELQRISDHPHVSGQEQVEEVNLKKKKLNLKDQMIQMINDYRQDQLSHQHP